MIIRADFDLCEHHESAYTSYARTDVPNPAVERFLLTEIAKCGPCSLGPLAEIVPLSVEDLINDHGFFNVQPGADR